MLDVIWIPSAYKNKLISCNLCSPEGKKDFSLLSEHLCNTHCKSHLCCRLLNLRKQHPLQARHVWLLSTLRDYTHVQQQIKQFGFVSSFRFIGYNFIIMIYISRILT